MILQEVKLTQDNLSPGTLSFLFWGGGVKGADSITPPLTNLIHLLPFIILILIVTQLREGGR